ncbi:MAG: cyclase family protein [Gammaproteobacteria bacterium]|nr:cyclase family protein [Gammaproteobacteria bacterium]
MKKRWRNRPEGSNWGDFGVDDQLGRLNLLSPEKVKQGVAEVRDGRSFCLSLPLDLPGGNSVNPKRHPPKFGHVYESGNVYFNYHWHEQLDGVMDVSSDEVVTLYSQYSTQWDSFAHVGQLFDADGDGVAEPVYYNGYRAYEHVGRDEPGNELGARALGIENMAETGVQGRGVLVDFHAHFGNERVAVDRDALEEVLARDGVSVEEGDMLLMHTGWDDLILSMGGDPNAKLLHESCAVLDGFDDRLLDWITESGVAVIATDNMAVEDPHGSGASRGGRSRLPLHRHCLFRLGIHLGELWYLSELAAELRRQKRFRFLLTAPPLRMPGAVGSPVTPVATL